jgi:hypothetical protein
VSDSRIGHAFTVARGRSRRQGPTDGIGHDIGPLRHGTTERGAAHVRKAYPSRDTSHCRGCTPARRLARKTDKRRRTS